MKLCGMHKITQKYCMSLPWGVCTRYIGIINELNVWTWVLSPRHLIMYTQIFQNPKKSEMQNIWFQTLQTKAADPVCTWVFSFHTGLITGGVPLWFPRKGPEDRVEDVLECTLGKGRGGRQERAEGEDVLGCRSSKHLCADWLGSLEPEVPFKRAILCRFSLPMATAATVSPHPSHEPDTLSGS